MRGCLITFEGCDGSGKSSQITRVAKMLEGKGFDVLVTREPGGTPLGEAVRQLLLDKDGPERGVLAEAFLYCACRAELVEKVLAPSLRSCKMVLVERYTDSTLAYQGFAGGASLGEIERLNSVATGGLVPDLTVVFDVSDSEVTNRRLASRERDRIEERDEQYHERVRQAYRTLAKRYPERIRIVDASAPEDEVFERVMAIVEDFLRKRSGVCAL